MAGKRVLRRVDRGRRFVVVAVLGAVIAVGTPAAWWLTRPAPDAGAPVVLSAATPASGSSAEQQGRSSSPPSTANGSAGGTAGVAVRSAGVPALTPSDPNPVRLRIGALDVDAPVVPAGVRPDGSMDIPENSATVGWYRFGPAPGAAEGSAVLAGHVDTKKDGPGALFALRDLAPGARIDVVRADGSIQGYRVTGRQTIVKKRLPTDQLFTRTGAPRLVLITCGGPFIAELSSYRDNLVVAADPIS